MNKFAKIIALLLLIATFAFANWTGSTSEPGNMRKIDGKTFYEITSADELAWFAAQVNGGNATINAVLGNDIVFGNDKNTTGTVNWVPIGKDSLHQYAGVFDGAGHTIYGINIKNSKTVGFIGYLTETGIVKNVIIANGSINAGGNYVGAIAAINYGTIQNSENHSSVSNTSSMDSIYSGGIVGSNEGIILDCYNKGKILAKSKGSSTKVYSGGIAGYNAGEIQRCDNVGYIVSEDTINGKSLKSLSFAGGIVGLNSGTISNCLNRQNVYSRSYSKVYSSEGKSVSSYAEAYSGGIFGSNKGVVFKCYNKSQIYSYSNSSAISNSSDCFTSGSSTNAHSYSLSGGIGGYNTGDIYNCYSDYTGFASATGSSKYNHIIQVGYSCETIDGKNDIKNYSGGIVGQNYGITKSSYYKTEYWLNNTKVTGTLENMQKDQFAWILNTCNGTEENSGVWTRGIEGYPTFANENSLAIYKVVFNDDGTTSNRYTNYQGVVTFPNNPEPTEGYVFTGWFNAEDTKVKPTTVFTADQTVNAVYVDASDVYWTINFYNAAPADTILETKSYQHGSIVTYGGVEPTLTSTAKYTYTFKGWDVDPTNAVDDFNYHALYDSTIRSYTIEFNNSDGSKIESASFEYGKMPSCSKIPTRAATVEWQYTHKGWKPALDYVTEGTSYTAIYDSSKVEYKVTFMNGTEIIDEQMVPYGGAAVAPTNVMRDGYKFVGWSTTFSKVTESLTVKALFEELIYYTVNVVNENGEKIDEQKIEDGQKYTLPEAPKKDGYTFNGWFDGEGELVGNSGDKVTITENLTFKAKYTVISYVITFADEDGSEISSTKVAYENMPTPPEDPMKASTAQYTYSFAGWDKEISKVTGATTYTATYSATIRSYTITFVNEDGSEISSTKVAYGKLPTTPEDPTKTSTAQYTYAFAGWDKEIVNVTGTATYMATYNKFVRKYTVTFFDFDGSILDEQFVAYGNSAESPEKPIRKGYKFIGWDSDFSNIVKAVDVTALYEELLSSSSAKSSSSSSVISSSSFGESSSSFSAISSSSSAKSSSSSSAKSSSSSVKKSDAIVVGLTPTFHIDIVGRNIQILNAKTGATLTAFDMQGRIILTQIVNVANFSVSLPRAGRYIISIDNTYKVVQVK